jgi:hypothetical protein
MKSDEKPSRKILHSSPKAVNINPTQAIERKLLEIKNTAGSSAMSEWNLSLFKHLK